MHCPSCGDKASPSQRFCRSCGFNLEKVSELIAEQLSLEGTQTSAELSDHRRIMERLATVGGLAFIGGGTLFITYLIYNIITKLIIGKGQAVFGSVLLLVLVGAVLLLSYVFYTESQKVAVKRKRESSSPEIEGVTTRALENPAESMRSVTEGTTELLETHGARVGKSTGSDELQT